MTGTPIITQSLSEDAYGQWLYSGYCDVRPVGVEFASHTCPSLSLCFAQLHACVPLVCVGRLWTGNQTVLASQRGSSVQLGWSPEGSALQLCSWWLQLPNKWPLLKWWRMVVFGRQRWKSEARMDWLPCPSALCLRIGRSVHLQHDSVVLFQRSQTQSPTPPKPPSPSFELGLSNFPPLPGAAGHLKTEDLFENRLSSLLIGSSKERVRYIPLMFA